MKALLRALPDIARLIARLVGDPVLPRAAKIALAAAALYLVSPFDLIPDFIPVVGYLDDALLAAVLVDGIVNYVDRGLVLKYWPDTPESLDRRSRGAASGGMGSTAHQEAGLRGALARIIREAPARRPGASRIVRARSVCEQSAESPQGAARSAAAAAQYVQERMTDRTLRE